MTSKRQITRGQAGIARKWLVLRRISSPSTIIEHEENTDAFHPLSLELLGVVLIAIVAYGGTRLVRAVRASGAGHDHTVFSAQLPNVPGKTLTAIVVEYGPGGSSPAHHHAGSVFAYVLSGESRSENPATGPVRVYRAGQGKGAIA